MANRNKVHLKVQKRSGFDKSHVNLLTGEIGVITPIMIDELPGNSRVHCRLNLAATMPPLVSDTFMKCDIAVEAFFIPLRLCYGGFEQWYCQRNDNTFNSIDVDGYPTVSPAESIMPTILVVDGIDGSGQDGDRDFREACFGPRSLSDYLGFCYDLQSNRLDETFAINPLPFIAYHLCYEHYYRAPLVETSAFARLDFSGEGWNVDHFHLPLGALPFVTLSNQGNDDDNVINFYDGNAENHYNCYLADSYNLFRCRHRNFDLDYFTNAYPTPQLGDDVSVDSVSSFTIASLRAANSLQQFKERNQIAGTRYQDTLQVRTGASISDGVAQRPVLLGSARYNVYNKGVYVTAPRNASSSPFSNSNPFSAVAGASGGVMYASGSDIIIDGFEAKEPGYILVNATFVPSAAYSNGISRLLMRYRDLEGSITDIADGVLQNVGNQPIYNYELTGRFSVSNKGQTVRPFGYTDRYADWMTMKDEIHGLFRKTQNLDSFVLQRYIADGANVQIGTYFLEIPTTFMDGVCVLADSTSNYGFWLQCAFDYKVSMPLAEYSVPSLQNPAYEHGDDIVVHRGGFRF